MPLIKNAFPILEYDTDKKSILLPDPDTTHRLPKKCVVSFSDYVYQFADRVHATVHSEFVTCTKTYKIFVTNHSGHDVCFCEVPLGASASVQLVDHLLLSGVTQIIASGSCGALIDIPENEILVPVKALRDEGVSYHYLKPSRFISLNRIAIDAIEQALRHASVEYQKCITWTTDGFFRETKKMTAYRKEEGCQVVEMECAAIAACAKFRNSIYGHILFSGDSLADAEKHDQRNWGASSIEKAFLFSLDAVIRIPQ